MNIENIINNIKQKYSRYEVDVTNFGGVYILDLNQGGKLYCRVNLRKIDQQVRADFSCVYDGKYVDVQCKSDLHYLFANIDKEIADMTSYYAVEQDKKVLRKRLDELNKQIITALRKDKVLVRTTHNLDNCVMGHIDSADAKNKITYRLLHEPRGFIASIIDGEDTTDYYADSEFDEFMADLRARLHYNLNAK